MKSWRTALPIALSLAWALPVHAGGGPRNVLVVVNEASEESLEIANTYVQGRRIPASNICRIRTTTALETDKATYQAEIETPVMQCIAASPYSARIDYIVLTRGMPIRAWFPDPSAPPSQPVSITALLQAMDTSLRGKDQEYGGPTYGFQFFPNPYKGRDEYFAHSKLFGADNLYVATMLSGYWSEDGNHLVERSLASDGRPPSAAPAARMILEDGSGAANVRDTDFDAAAANLIARGVAAVHVTGADPEITGEVVASHVTAGVYSANSQAQIASNTYPPGAICDVLESFGLTPSNFTPGLADQVPVTWWITAGVTGAEGTVAEPYNVAFPDGFMMQPYVDGYNLGESWYQSIPYLYWMNLVLGDPLAAPYARPLAVAVDYPADGDVVSGPVRVGGTASTTAPGGIRKLEIFADDTLLGTVTGATGDVPWNTATTSDGWHHLDVVAYESSRYFTQRTAGVDVMVDNRSLSMVIAAPADGAVVAGTFAVTITGSAGLQDVTLESEGFTLGAAVGSSPFTVSADSSLLGRGIHRLVATGRDGAGGTVRSRPVTVQVVKAPRLYAALAPANGPQGGGTVVTIDGWNFEPAVEVWFGPNRATSVVRDDANHLRATTPRGAPGPVDVRFVNPVGQEMVVRSGFTYDPETCSDPTDSDGDLTCDVNDNCPTVPNPGQEDRDGNGIGDACEGCAATASMAGLTVTRSSAGGLRLDWPDIAERCRASYVVLVAADPARPVAFPGGYVDASASDTDGSSTDPTATLPLPAGGLVFLQVAGRGTDGGLGPQ